MTKKAVSTPILARRVPIALSKAPYVKPLGINVNGVPLPEEICSNCQGDKPPHEDICVRCSDEIEQERWRGGCTPSTDLEDVLQHWKRYVIKLKCGCRISTDSIYPWIDHCNVHATPEELKDRHWSEGRRQAELDPPF